MTPEKIKDAAKTLAEKLKSDKRLLFLLAVGLALLLAVAGLDVRSSRKASKPLAASEVSEQAPNEEARLCALLSAIKGAGSVRVMITYSEQTQTVYAADRQSDFSSEPDGETRRRESENPVVLKGSDAQSGLVERTIAPKVQGVAVVCAGAHDPAVQTQIIAAVAALFDLKSTHISVAELANEGGLS